MLENLKSLLCDGNGFRITFFRRAFGGAPPMIKDPKKLIDLAEGIVQAKDLQPIFNDGHFAGSFCNRGADRLFRAYGGPGFPHDDKGNAILADQIYCWMQDSKDFRQIEVGTVQALADAGSLVFLCATSKMLGQEAGHIATGIPGPTVPSGHWGCEAPTVCNVGEKNFIGGANFAFRTPPTFFLFVPSL